MRIKNIDSKRVKTNELPIGEIHEVFCSGAINTWSELKDFELFTLDGIKPAARMYKTEGETYTVFIECGTQLSGLAEHKLYVFRDNEFSFVRLDELKIGDLLLHVSDDTVRNMRDGLIDKLPLAEFTKVSKIEHNKKIETVYDFEVPTQHHYVTSNILSHNTSFSLQLAQNLSELGLEDVAYVPLEMDEDETMERILANKASVKLSRIKQKKTTPQEDRKIKEAYKNHVKKLKENNTRFTIFSPDEDVTIEEVLMTLKPYGYRVIIIDYLTLLKGTDGDDAGEKQWQKIGQIGRRCKLWAKANDAVVILVAQVDDEGKLRYSRALKEHANILWTWGVNKETRENKIMKINTEKARNLVMQDFDLSYDDEMFQVFDVGSSRHDNVDDINNPEEYLANIDDEEN